MLPLLSFLIFLMRCVFFLMRMCSRFTPYITKEVQLAYEHHVLNAMIAVAIFFPSGVPNISFRSISVVVAG